MVMHFHTWLSLCNANMCPGRRHPTIMLLWEVIHELPVDVQKRFLFFCTGSDRVPIKGLGNLNFVISRNGTDESRLYEPRFLQRTTCSNLTNLHACACHANRPSAHTCFNHLLLPEYRHKEHLKSQLLKAIMDTEGFHII